MKKYENKIVAGDCLDILPKLPTGVVDLAFADPPFNIGFGYDVYNDRRDKSEYLEWTERWLTALRRVLKPSGSLYADKRANPAGKIPDDTWIVSRVCGTFKERTDHPCQMPEKILERVIQATSNECDLVLDPFAGSGTTLAVAKRLGRRFIGIELSIRYAIEAQNRVNKTGGGDINAIIMKCGHLGPAIGSPGAPAREACEQSECLGIRPHHPLVLTDGSVGMTQADAEELIGMLT